MVRISEIQQFPEFLETFPGNFCAICRCLHIFERFGWMESAPIFPAQLHEDSAKNPTKTIITKNEARNATV